MERKEAMEIVRKLYNDSLFLKKDKKAMVTLIPELKESEDKVMRKNLLELVAKHCGKTCEMYLWLEKQGEQKPDTDFSDLRTWKYIVDAVLTEREGIGQYLDSPFTEEVAKKLQKRFGNIEPKPADKVEPKFKEE